MTMKKNFLLAIISLVVLLAVLESAARLGEYIFAPDDTIEIKKGWQTEFFGSALDWHESDPDLLWRYKPNLDNRLIKTNSSRTLGDEISKKKNSLTYRILLLGDSSPVGLGLHRRSQAFGEQLRARLEQDYIGLKNVELVNAAVSGYTSEQIARYFELEGLSYNPDLVILYCGNNDASISGIYADRELLESQSLKSLRRFLGHFALYRIMKNLLVPASNTDNSDITALRVRVSPERYGENLKKIADACKSHECRLIILKPPVPYLWPAGLQFKLSTHLAGKTGELIFPEALTHLLSRKIKYCLDERRFKDIYGEGDIFTREVYHSAYNDSLSPAQAVEYYSKLLENNSADPVILNNLGVSFWQNNQNIKADLFLKAAREQYLAEHALKESDAFTAAGTPFLYNIGINLLTAGSTDIAGIYLDSALQADYFSLRIKNSYLQQIDYLTDYDGVTIINLPEIFKKNGGEKLFIDHCHPSEKGHRLIADALYNIIKKQ